MAAHIKSEIIQARKLISGQVGLGRIVHEQAGAYQEERTEVKVITDAACLIVDHRMPHCLPILYGVVVGIEPGGSRVGGYP